MAETKTFPADLRDSSLKFAVDSSNIISADWSKTHRLSRFEHQAMATIFEIILYHPDLQYAAQAAQAAFMELDGLEQELSRFSENSDISRINRAVPGEPVKVGLDAFTCLQHCQQICRQTDGAFDITVGALVDYWRHADPASAVIKNDLNLIKQKTGPNYLVLNADNYSAQRLKAGLNIDLGGFGKGYALDNMAAIIAEWGISCALLHSGKSTVLASAAPAEENSWPLALRHPYSGKVIRYISLAGSAISGSGLQKGAHIVNPRSGRPVKDKVAAWSTAATAALADALSTAFMIMTNTQIKKFIQQHPETAACVLTNKNPQILSFGQI
jgi:thiamine biosynthesis lipoprotein